MGGGRGLEGVVVTPGRDARLHLIPWLRYQVTAAAVQGRQRQNAAHLLATHSIIINTRVVIKGQARIKHGCAGENSSR